MIITVADQDKNLCRYARYAETPPYASGWQTFSYGKLGELTENIRTFALPFENQTYTFKMQYKYDSYNRIQEMTYPDGEVVHYDYNRGGQLTKVYGTVIGEFAPQYPSMPHDSMMPLNSQGLNGQASLNSLPEIGDPVPLYTTHTYPYIDSIVYNEFEQRSEVFHGNGTHTLYVYDSLRRLFLLQSQTHAGDIMQDIVYTYDSVSNITGIVNSAAMLPNGLGGAYSSSYEYDNLYRLVNAEGGWQGLHNLSFHTGMGYHANGRVRSKKVTARTLLNGHSDTVDYSHDYYYENPVQRNTLTRVCLDPTGEYNLHYSWTPAGNMDTCDTEEAGSRRLCWDEQNRLLGARDNKWLSYYLYDASDDRTYKLTGKGNRQNLSGEWHYYYTLDNATLYASPYLVATRRGYTKHYYAETERIASRVGGGGLQEIDMVEEGQSELIVSHQERFEELFNNLAACLDADFHSAEDMLKPLYKWQNVKKVESDCYWYHPDHLGSSSWITDSAGTAVQHLHYLPWGEDFVNQRTSSFSSMYTFSAKEKDKETGYSYFGSRYYSSDLSIWLSVDPMSDKYPSLSPYTYCADNPVKLVDPNGEEVDWVERTIYGRKEIYYDRDVKSQSDVDRIYGSNSGVRHLADGTKVGNGQYTVYNDNKENKYGVVKDANGNIVRNHKNIIYGRGFVLFAGVTDESLNPKTLHNNLMKTSYTGGKNPKSYNEEDNFEYKSRNLSERFSITHDQQYAALKAEGLKGVFGTTDTWKADLQLAFSNAVTAPINPDPIDRARSVATASLFAQIGLTKAVIHGAKKLFSR